MFSRNQLSLLLLYLVLVNIANADSSYLLEQEIAFDDQAHSSKFETILKHELNHDISEDWQLTMINRLRFDLANELGPLNERAENYGSLNGSIWSGNDGNLEIRELFVDGEIGESYWRIGKQQVVWGQADGLKVLDKVNPQSFREFILDDFEDSRIPLWMLNVEFALNDNENLQLLWIPDHTYNELAQAATKFVMTSELLIPSLSDLVNVTSFKQLRPNSPINDSEFGVRYSNFYQGWDLTANYLYHFHDNPVVFQSLASGGLNLRSQYKRNHLAGLTASNAFGDFSFRAEVGYNSDTYQYTQANKLLITSLGMDLIDNGTFKSAELASVFGIDWQGLEDSLISLQWFQSYLLDYESNRNIIRDKQNNVASFLFKRTFNNETITFDLLALHGFNDSDGSLQVKLSYQLESNVNLWVGSDIFYGDSSGLFGQFSKQDQITLGWQLGF
ncbi:MAG: hypothetical protein KUG78_20795 [Kangiellaceae bacterium]|nr:hypothetical protein [Kangiellaceae bacterium]